MDIDPMESVESAKEEKSRLNAMVAVTIALLATFLGLCNVKDGNVAQNMQKAQVEKLDNWTYFQEKNTQAKVLMASASQLRFQAQILSADKAALAAAEAGKLEAKAKDIDKERNETIKPKAEQAEKVYDSLNFVDDQFDLADGLCALAISLLAITSLTQKKWLYWVALVPTILGLIMGLAGFFHWPLHPDAITNLLS